MLETLSRGFKNAKARLTGVAELTPENIDEALRDGFTSGGGLGLGLGGAKRLSNDFSIDSAPGQGTRIMIARWK